jgi:hypothetical protein
MEIEREFFENGKIHREGQINKDNQLHGYFREYHKNGQLRLEVNFKNDIQCPGEVTSFHENGKKKRQVFVDDKQKYNGEFFEWYDNGSIKIKGFYKNGEFDGDFKEFFENGALKAELKYKEGKIIARTDYLDNGLKLNEVKVKSNSELRDKINECLSISEGEIYIENFEIDIDKDQSRWCGRQSYIIGDYQGYKYYCKVAVEKKREEIYDSNVNGIYDYIKDLANGKSLIGTEEINSFLKKLDDAEIHQLLYPRFENENFIVESKAIEDGAPDEILSKFNEDEDFFSDNVRNFVFWNDDLKHYAYYKGRNLFQKDWSVVNLIKFNLKSSNIALQINWVYNNKISGNAGEFLRNKYFWERYNFSPKLNLLFTFNLCDSIASILYGFLLEKASIMQIMISYVAWKNSISLLLKDEKNNDFNNYLAEACHYLIFKSNGFGDHEDDIIESRINAIKDINFDEELEINLKLNLYLCLYTNAALKFIDENKDYGSVSGDKIRDLKSLSTKLLNHLHQADELFKVIS